MSIRYRNANGDEVICAGLTPGGDIEAGAVATRSGTINITGPIAPGATTASSSVTFDEPMPDSDYIVTFNCNTTRLNFIITNQTANGFTVSYSNVSAGDTGATVTITWKAVKTYTVQHAAQNAESIATLEAMIPAEAGSGNKLVTASQLSNTTTPIAEDVADLQDLVPLGASISNQLATASDVNAKQDTLTFDNTPTDGSTNPVTSDGIFEVNKVIQDDLNDLDTEIDDYINNYGSKNLFDGYFNNQILIANINYTNIKQERPTLYPVTDTSERPTYFWTFGFYAKAGTYRISVHGEDYLSINRIALAGSPCDQTQVHLRPGLTFTTTADGWSYFSVERDTGELDYADYPFEGHDLKIMIRKASIEDETFAPYAKTNTELTDDTTNLYHMNTINGTKNLLIPTTLTQFKDKYNSSYYSWTGNTVAINNGDVTVTINEDGTYTLQGTPTSRFPFAIAHNKNSSAQWSNFLTPLLNKKLILSGSYGSIQVNFWNDTTRKYFAQSLDGTDSEPFTIDSSNYTSGDTVFIEIVVPANTATVNSVVRPMIRLADDENSTYAQYTMTNLQLTQKAMNYNNIKCLEIPVSAVPVGSTLDITLFKTWLDAQGFATNTKLFLHCPRGSEMTLVGTYTQPLAWAFIAFSYNSLPQLWRCSSGVTNVKTFTLT